MVIFLGAFLLRSGQSRRIAQFDDLYAQGSARLTAGGESWDLVTGTLVRVGAAQKRKIVPGPKGATILALGGTPGKAYEPPSRSKRNA